MTETVMAAFSDIEEVTKLRMKYFDEVYESMTPEKRNELFAENIKILKEELGETLFIALTRQDGKVVSSSYMTVIRKAANLRFTKGLYGEIYGVYTDEEHRRRGYAQKQIELLLKKAEEMALSYVELEASPDGVYLYEKTGFKYVNAVYKRMEFAFEEGVIL